MTSALADLLETGARDGSLRTDVTPGDVLLLLDGLAIGCITAPRSRLVDLIMDALTTDPTAS